MYLLEWALSNKWVYMKDSTQSNYKLVPRVSPHLAPWDVKRGDPGNEVDQIIVITRVIV